MKKIITLVCTLAMSVTMSTGQNLELVSDINQLTEDLNSSSIPSQLFEFNGNLYFSGSYLSYGKVLLRFDGTDISMVDESNIAGTSYPRYLTQMGNKLYYLSAEFSSSDMKLMEFDGVNPPQEVYDINVPFDESYPQPYVYNGGLVFAAYSTSGNWDLVTYSSAAASSVISSTSGGSNYCSIRGITSINNLLYYYADGLGFFTYNGSGGPMLAPNSSVFTAVSSFYTYNNAIYFAGFETTNLELWKYDGSVAPSPVPGIAPGSRLRVNLSNESLNVFEVFNNELYFDAREGTGPSQLWKTDGTNTSFVDIASLGALGARQLKSYNGNLYFAAFESATGVELWSYDGVTASLVQDLFIGSSSSGIDGSIEFSNKLYFGASNGDIHGGLFAYDETSIERVMDDTINKGSQIEYLTKFKNKIYLRATGASGSELYVTDGNTTNLVADLTPGFNAQNVANNSSPEDLFVFNDKLYFIARDTNISGFNMFEYDGNNVPVVNQDLSASDLGFHEYKGELYFSSTRGAEGKELWKYDGTNAPVLVADIYPGSTSSSPAYFFTYQDKLIFAAADSAHGYELWQYDGVSAPSLVADINPTVDSDPSNFAEFNGKLYFSAFGGDSIGRELYEYDGVNPPVLTADLWTGSQSGWPNESEPEYFKVINNKLVFVANNQGYIPNLWEYDGTTAPVQITNYNPIGSVSRQFTSMTEINGKLYFWADAGNGSGAELYVYDGISAPVMFQELSPGIHRSRALRPSNIVELNGYAYLNANDWLIGGPLDGIGELYRFKVCSAPTVSIVQNGDTLQADPGFVSYQWYNSQGAISGATSSAYIATINDTYYCEVSNSENCKGTSNIINVTVSNTLELSNQSVSVYPNPTSGLAYIEFGEGSFKGEVRVVNALGQEVSRFIIEGAQPLQIQLPDGRGIYVVEVTNKTTQTTERLKLIRK